MWCAEPKTGKRCANYLDISSSSGTIADHRLYDTSGYLSPSSHGHDFAWRARASYVTTVQEMDGRACPKQTSSIQSKNSLYPVSVGCGTRLMTSFVLFLCEGVNWPFLQSHSLFAWTLSFMLRALYFWCIDEYVTSVTVIYCMERMVVWTGVWAEGVYKREHRGILG